MVSNFDVWRLGLMASAIGLMFCIFPHFSISISTRKQRFLPYVLISITFPPYSRLSYGLAVKICVHAKSLWCERFLLTSRLNFSYTSYWGTVKLSQVYLIDRVGNDYLECFNRFFHTIGAEVFRKLNGSTKWCPYWRCRIHIRQTLPIRPKFELRRPTPEPIWSSHVWGRELISF